MSEHDIFNEWHTPGMTTERNAQGVDGLAEMMGLLDRAFDMPLRWSESGNIVPLVYTQDCEIAAVYTDREDNGCPNTAAALIAAVNYLRSHGEAIGEATEALREIAEVTTPGDGVPNVEWVHERATAALAKFSTEGQ